MAPLLPKNAYRLPYNIFNVFSCKTGKHDAYQTLTDTYHETVPPPPPKNAYRLPYSIFYWKSVYLPPKLVSTTLTMVSITLTKRHCPHTPIKIAYRLPNSICDALPLPTPQKCLPAYHGKHHASHEALPPPTFRPPRFTCCSTRQKRKMTRLSGTTTTFCALTSAANVTGQCAKTSSTSQGQDWAGSHGPGMD